MLRHCKITVAILVVLVSLLSGFHPIRQTFAQSNESVKILITDAIEDLQNNDTNTALAHSHLASQKLSSQGVSSSDFSLVLINDAIRDLLNNDTDTAFTHLGLVNEQLETTGGGATTSAVSLNEASALNTTLTEKQKENATMTVGKYQCTDNNLNGRCSLDEPKSAASLCTDVNQDLYCDWFKPVNVHPNGTITVNATASPPPMEINLCTDNDYDGICDIGEGKGVTTIKNKCPDNNRDNVCEWYLGVDGVWYPAGEGPTGYIVNTTSINGTEIPPLVTAEDACYNDGFNDGQVLEFKQSTAIRCSSPNQSISNPNPYNVGHTDGCMSTGMSKMDCGTLAMEQIGEVDTSTNANTNASKGNTSDSDIDGLPANLPAECYIYDEAGEVFGVYSEGICAGQQTPQQTSGSNMTDDFEYCEDFNNDQFCDITHSSDGSIIVEDQEAIERLKEGNNGMPETQRQPSGSISVPVQPQQIRINWGAICRNPIVDSFISEPCGTLTSPDGFTLTSRGHRVIVCLGVGGVATYLAPEILASIKSLGPAAGCGSNTGSEPSPLGQGNPLDTMLGGLFRK